MSFFNEKNKNMARKELTSRGFIGNLQIINAYKSIPIKYKITGQPVLDLASYVTEEDIYLVYK